MRRRTPMPTIAALGLSLALSLSLAAVIAPTQPARAGTKGPELPVPKGGKLVPADRTALAGKAARHQQAGVMVLAGVGQGAELAGAVRAGGGRVTSADDAAGWVTATMPAARALELERAGLVRALGLDRRVRVPVVPALDRKGAAGAPAAGARRPSAATGPANPWLPTADIHAPQFVAGHRAWDGRGVKLAVLDTGVDWTAPGLARTTTGARKVTAWHDLTGEGLVSTDLVVHPSGQRFAAAGATWTLPAGPAARVRFGTLAESSLAMGDGIGLDQDLNRDGDAADSFGVVAIDAPASGLTVRVDTDADHSFADERVMRDFNHFHATDTFGRDDPATPGIRELVGFGVLACTAGTDNPCAAPLAAGRTLGDAWTIAFDGGTHGTNVASIAAGNDFGPAGARFQGVAPGAQVWSVKVLRSDGVGAESGIGDGIIRAAELGADVINLSLGALPMINVGAPLDPSATLIDNVSKAYGVAFAIAAGNDGPALNTVSSPGTAAGAVTAGASISPLTWDVNYDRPGVPSEGLLYFSAAGPLEDGGFKPDVVAPGSALAAVPAWQDWTGDVFAAGRLPAGYAVYQGTSMAAPEVAGAQALLLSAARQRALPVTPHQLKRALELGARRLGPAGAYQPAETGHGLVQVDRAWDWLGRLGAEERDVAALTGNFTLGVGTGVYDREAFATAEDSLLYTFGPETHTYRLGSSAHWLWATPGQVTVPGADGGIPEDPRPGIGNFTTRFDSGLAFRPGLHAAVLRADDPATPDPADLEMLDTVVTPYVFSGRTANTWRFSGAGRSGIEAEKLRRFFFEVPKGAGALALSAASRAAEKAGLVMYVTDPLGVPYTTATGAFTPGGHADVTVQRPVAGTWEVTLHARERAIPGLPGRPRSLPVLPYHGFTLTAKLLTASLSPSAWSARGATPGQRLTQDFTATNTGAGFTGLATGTGLARTNEVRREIAGSGGELRFPVTVEPGTTRLTASIGNPSDDRADLDLYLYDPAGNLYAYDADGDADERVEVDTPTPGTWRVGVNPYETPQGVTDYDWRVDLARPGLGRITTSDAVQDHPRGSRWRFAAFVTAPAPPPAGWVWTGRVVVADASGAEISDAEVTIGP